MDLKSKVKFIIVAVLYWSVMALGLLAFLYASLHDLIMYFITR